MSTTLTVHDASTVDHEGYAFLLDLDSETISVRELIRSRVFQEVQEFNAKQSLHFRGLIQPAGAEATPCPVPDALKLADAGWQTRWMAFQQEMVESVKIVSYAARGWI